jgi:CubicO group peptidase (beta-lactamase class C family)
MDSHRLAGVYEYAANSEINTEGLIIIRNGYIVGEAYFGDFTAETRHYSYSICKSFTSALVGIAIDKGYLNGIHEKVYTFYPQWQTDETPAARKAITIWHLLAMMSGIEWDETDYYTGSRPNDAYIMYRQPDMIDYILAKPMVHTPGARWNYSTGNSQLLSGILEATTGGTAYEFALEHLLQPIGLADIRWDHDRAGHTQTGSGIHATVREYARFGYLYLRDGEWDGQQIVPQSWVEESCQPAYDELRHYGYHWWLKPVLQGHKGSVVPDGTFIAWGIHTQQIFVIPEEDLVIVRVGDDDDPHHDEWKEVEFLTLVMNAIIEPEELW